MSIISSATDKLYRRVVVEAAGFADSAVQKELERLFKGQPDPGGAERALAELGPQIDEMTKRTARVVEALEHFYPGFQNWLGTSGWGNDVRLIRLLHAWQLEAERKKWLHRSKMN